VLFNNGQYVQWITPWDWFPVLTQYRDRQGGNNWAHIYGDWADLKARHAVEPHSTNPNCRDLKVIEQQREIALAIFELYFDRSDQNKPLSCKSNQIWTPECLLKLLPEDYKKGEITLENAVINWVNDLIQVGWQFCNKVDFFKD
jgi:CRISPR-associated protein Cmr2